MTIRWLTAFVDFPAEGFDAGSAFWSEVTGTTMSPRRGENNEFATLVPADGDAYLRVQQLGSGPGRIHLDLHVEDTADTVACAVAAGATVIGEADVTTLRSPGGFVFCVVDHHGEATIPVPTEHDGLVTRMNQLCIDIPAALFEDECVFWSRVAQWDLRPDTGTEYGALTTPDSMPFRLLFQRLGDNDQASNVRAHLDVGAGDHWPRSHANQHHAGAEHQGDGSHWAVFHDPTGQVYCVTGRDPER